MSAVQTSMTIHFLGGGNMATAIIQGLSKSAPDIQLVVADPSEVVRARHQANGLKTHADIEECEHVQCIVLAVKPQYFPGTLKSLSHALQPNALIVSVMAGISTETIESSFPDARVIRTMPNTPMAVAQGMVGLARGQKATAQDMEFACQMFASSGEVLTVDESQMNAITAISGSGPAYFFRFCEIMVQAAKEVGGFSNEEAELLVRQTAQGAMAYLASQDGFPAARLAVRSQVSAARRKRPSKCFPKAG